MLEIHGKEKVTDHEKVKVNMHTNLKKLIIENNVPKVHKGSEKERKQWVLDANSEIIAGKWKIYDEDKNGAMDEDECFNLLQSLNPS